MSKLVHQTLSPRALLAALALVLLIAVAVSMPAEAVNPRGCMGPGTVVTYYSDETQTREVGRYTTSCVGECSGRGRVTEFFTVAFLPCPPPGGEVQ